jgi:hypothetical protein
MMGTIFILFNLDIYSEIWQKGGKIKIMFWKQPYILRDTK